ncbi:membrane protein [Gordonia phage RayTheFireFly]|nr:membrane protein [Gordonia phage RayTheFireFly]
MKWWLRGTQPRRRYEWLVRGLEWVVPLSIGAWGMVWVLNNLFPGVQDKVWGNASLFLITIQLVAFTAIYGFRSHWNINPVGRMFLWHSTVMSLVMFQVSMSAATSSDYPGREYIRPIIYALGVLSYAAMTVTLLRQQHRDRKAAKHD